MQVEGKVRLPLSSQRTRNNVTFAKLLTRVDPAARNGFGWEGSFHRPGDWVDLAELPERAILLEHAGKAGKHRDDPSIYILWQLDRTRGEWRKLAEAHSSSWEWSLELAPIASRALQPVRLVADLRAVAERITSLIDAELEHLEPRERAQLAGILHDRFAAEYVQAVA